MCKFCENYNKKSLPINEIFIASPAKYTYVGDGKEYPIPMFYCPYCGNKLIERNKKQIKKKGYL